MSDLIEFLDEYKGVLRLSALERETGIYQGAITKVVNETEYRHLTPDQEKAVRKYLLSMAKKIEKNLVD